MYEEEKKNMNTCLCKNVCRRKEKMNSCVWLSYVGKY